MKLTVAAAPHEYRWCNVLSWVGKVTAQHARIIIVPVLIATVLAARGCASPQRAPVDDTLFARISMQPATDALLAADMFPANAASLRYMVAAGDDSGRFMSITREPTDKHDASWAYLEDDLRAEYWSSDEQGNVLLMAVYDAQDNAVSLFDPPLTIPSELRPGQPHHEEAAMRVVDSRDLSIQKASGKATRSMEYIDNQRIRTPMGMLDAQRLVVHFLAEMGVATAETTSTYYIVPGLGIVAEQTAERVRILGVFGRSMDRTIVLVEDN